MKLGIDVIEQGMQSLKELKNDNLLDVVDNLSDGSYRLKPSIFSNSGAVYAFWWTGPFKRFMTKNVNRIISFTGPKGKKVEVEFSDE